MFLHSAVCRNLCKSKNINFERIYFRFHRMLPPPDFNFELFLEAIIDLEGHLLGEGLDTQSDL